MSDDAKFCGSCGAPVAAPAAPWTPGPAPEAAPPEADGPVTEVMEESPAEAPAEAEQPAAEAPAEAPAEDPAETVEESAPEMPEEDPAPAGPIENTAPVNMPRFDIPYTEPQAEDGAAPGKWQDKAKFAVIGVAAVGLIALIAVGIWLITSLVGGGSKTLCVYLNDDGELMYLPNLKEDTKAVEISDEVDYGADVQFSRDGKTVYFLDEDSTLYQVATADLEKDGGKPDRISRNVSSYQVLDKGRVVYCEYNDGYKVSLYEDGQSSRLVKSCDNWSVSEDEKTLYYIEENDKDETYTLYKMALSGDGKEEELLDGYDILYTGYDAETLVYGILSEGRVDQETGRTSGNTLAIYSCKPGEKGTKLVSGIYTVNGVTVDGGKVSFYYVEEDVEKHTLYDFVSDTNAGADAAILQEDMPSYPSWYREYYPEDLYLENGQVYCIDAKGDVYPVDVQEYLTEIGLSAEALNYDWDLLYWNILYGPAYDDAYARYDAAESGYYDRYEEWDVAQSREYIREDLKETRYDQVSYSLYKYTGEKEGDPIATGLRSAYVNRAGDVFVYRKTAGVDVKKVADVAELEYSSQVYDLLGDGGSDPDWYQNVGGKESVLDIDEEDYVYGMYKVSDKEIVLYVHDGYEDRLDSFAIGADKLTLSDTIYEGDLSVAGMCEESGGKRALYLFTETETDYDYYYTLGDFCVYKDGKLETIAKEVYGAVILDKSGATYVVTDHDDEYNTELAVLKDGKPVTISDEVSGGGAAFLDGGQMLYVSDSDLYLWDGKESRRIARDVEYLWVSHEETYQSYNP